MKKISKESYKAVYDEEADYINNNIPLHGVYIQKVGNLQEKLFINKGYLMRCYKYPLIERLFKSKLINDYNLHFCGGWFWHNVNIMDGVFRVMNCVKPIGFFHCKNKEAYEMFIYMLSDKDREKLNSVTHFYNSEKKEIAISVNGTLADNFNLDALIKDYYSYAKYLNIDIEEVNEIKEVIYHLRDLELSEFLYKYDYVNPATDIDLVITGLILGYPIETTVSIIWVE